MKIKAKFEMFVAVGTLLFLSLPTLARPANSPQDQETAQTQSAQKGKNQKVQPGPGKEVGKGGEDIGKGAAGAGKDVGVGTGKGAAKIGKGSGKGIGKLGKKIFGKGGKNKKNSDIEN